jgi:hypothetical protein
LTKEVGRLEKSSPRKGKWSFKAFNLGGILGNSHFLISTFFFENRGRSSSVMDGGRERENVLGKLDRLVQCPQGIPVRCENFEPIEESTYPTKISPFWNDSENQLRAIQVEGLEEESERP